MVDSASKIIPAKLLDRVRKYTLLHPLKLDVVYEQALRTKKIPGQVAEVGVFKGGCSKLLALCLPNKLVYVFDTFEGLPEGDSGHGKGQFCASVEEVTAYLSDCSNVRIHKGIFPDTANPIKNETFSLVHLDVDLYKYTLSSLEFFYPRMSPGGSIVLDDYDFHRTLGVTKAIDEFFSDKDENIIITVKGQQAMVIKK